MTKLNNHSRSMNIIPLFAELYMTVEEKQSVIRKEIAVLALRPIVTRIKPKRIDFVSDESREARSFLARLIGR